VKAILIVLIILEVSLIASRYSMGFEDYITIVMLLLTLPLAFFGFHYLRSAYREARDEERFSKQAYRRVSPEAGSNTDEAVKQLLESPAYQEFERRKTRRQGEDEERPETQEQRQERE
jgi:hypothetical protein